MGGLKLHDFEETTLKVQEGNLYILLVKKHEIKLNKQIYFYLDLNFS